MNLVLLTINSPSNYDNSVTNYDNSPSNYYNSPSNYKNSSGRNRLYNQERVIAGYAVYSPIWYSKYFLGIWRAVRLCASNK